MVESIGTALENVITWLGKVISALTGEAGALAPLWPLLAIGIGISLLMLAVKVIRSFTWGA